MDRSESSREWLSQQTPQYQLEVLLRDHSEPVYGFSYRALGGSSGVEAQCSCGEWFPSYAHTRHVAQMLIEAGYSKAVD